MKRFKLGGSDKAKFKGHRVQLIGKHPQAGMIGTYVRDAPEGINDVAIVDIPDHGEVRVLKQKHWQLA
jgi:hypothetical protein